MKPNPLIEKLRAIVGPEGVLFSRYDLAMYEYDGSAEQGHGDAVVFPTSAEQVQEVMRLANREGVPIVGRGAGTGLSGGCLPLRGGIVVSFSKMQRILSIDYDNQRAVVEPGLVNLNLSQAMADENFYYVPDPSSQKACTIGGNVAENSGGPHTLIYGVTTNHVLALEVVLPNGEIVQLGGAALDNPGYDLVGLFVGSEGTMGLVTKVTVRICPKQEAVKTLLAVFNTLEDACSAVSGIIAGGIVPAALEMMDGLMVQAVEDAYHAGYPRDAEAMLLIEVEGLREKTEVQAEHMAEICRQNKARDVRVAKSDAERDLLWAGRKGAFGAIGRLSPEYYTIDGVVPRTRLPQVLREVGEIGKRYGIRIANVFHAGDGNLHPLLLFDARKPGELERIKQAGFEILELCASVGGSLTGEHGIGIEKNDAMPLIFNEDDLEVMSRVRRAWDPHELCNPGKVFPTPGRCAEMIEQRQRVEKTAAAAGLQRW